MRGPGGASERALIWTMTNGVPSVLVSAAINFVMRSRTAVIWSLVALAVVSQLQSQEKELKKEMAAKQKQDLRLGGAITAATFLKEFADGTPWVHLDIAGTAWLDDAKPFMSKGPSGVGVRTFVRLATPW